MFVFQRLWLVLAVWVASVSGAVVQAAEEGVVLYSTGFEVEEGYTPEIQEKPLAGQMGWVGEGAGRSGLVTNYFEGFGQQAYLGYVPPPPKDKNPSTSIWIPGVGFTNTGLNAAVLRFSVLMEVVDSKNLEYDSFRWSAYNTAGSRLFTLDFDNYDAGIRYLLDDNTGFVDTGFVFDNAVLYQLDVYMNFRRNNWIALLNGAVVVDSQPITTTNARLDLSDVDAVWMIYNVDRPGDNYLLFDNYQVVREPVQTIPPILETMGRRADGSFELWVHGERGMKYVVDVSEDLRAWTALQTNAPPEGLWKFQDTTAKDYAASFYRVREANP